MKQILIGIERISIREFFLKSVLKLGVLFVTCIFIIILFFALKETA